MYLRGFTGGTYQGNYWSGVDQKDFADAFSEADSGWQVQNILYRYIGSLLFGRGRNCDGYQRKSGR